MNNDLISVAKLTELFSKKIDEERKTKLLWILAIVGAVAAVVVAAHYIYRMIRIGTPTHRMRVGGFCLTSELRCLCMKNKESIVRRKI